MIDNELSVNGVGVDIGEKTIFDDLSFTISSGQLVVLTGPSGSGKTLLAHVIAGTTVPNRGEVLLNGTPLMSITALQERPVIVPQDFGLIATLTALENVSLPLQLCGIPKTESHARSENWLSQLGLEACSNRLVGELSGGQRQRVAIARALCLQAPVIVMDEPTAEIDAANRDLVLSLFATERERGAAMVVVSHDEDVIAQSTAVRNL